MHVSRQWLVLSTLVAVLAAASAAQPVAATIDATRTGPPITTLMFGGFMEPATTQVWAEMLSDRKFFNEITSQAGSRRRRPAGSAEGGRNGAGCPWAPTSSW